MAEYILPDAALIARARRGIEEVRKALATHGHSGWRVYALRAVEVRADEWLLYLITPTTSLPLTRALAAALALETPWVSGRLKAHILPVDFDAGGDEADAIYAVEVQQLVVPATKKAGRAQVSEGASILISLVDAREGAGVRLVIALERAPLGWPP